MNRRFMCLERLPVCYILECSFSPFALACIVFSTGFSRRDRDSTLLETEGCIFLLRGKNVYRSQVKFQGKDRRDKAKANFRLSRIMELNWRAIAIQIGITRRREERRILDSSWRYLPSRHHLHAYENPIVDRAFCRGSRGKVSRNSRNMRRIDQVGFRTRMFNLKKNFGARIALPKQNSDLIQEIRTARIIEGNRSIRFWY